MVLFVIGILVLIAGLIALVAGIALRKKNTEVAAYSKGFLIGGIVAIPVAILLVILSLIVTLNPGQIGIAYRLDGSKANLVVGRNFIEPWAKIHEWDATVQLVTFSEGSAQDDIFGAQTTEKDYIRAVATIGVHIDTERLNDYIALYGTEQISSQRILKMLKTISRNSIERAIGSYTTAVVMGNKKMIAEEATTYFKEAVAELPIVVDSFTIDDLVAPESYENAIREQAQLRMDRDKAELQQQVNEQQAAANKVKAEGEAAVLKTQAEAQAEVKRIEAENAATVKEIEAKNAAQVAKIKADNDAEVKRIQADADASVKVTQATAEAEATVKRGEAEATAIKAQGEAYKQNPELIDLRVKEIQAEVQSKWAEKWSGYSFEGMSGITFSNLTDILKGIIPTASNTK